MLEFFETSGRNLLTVEAPAGIRHHVALSIVGIDPEAQYWGGRVAEDLLVPVGKARLGRIGLDEWLRRSPAGG